MSEIIQVDSSNVSSRIPCQKCDTTKKSLICNVKIESLDDCKTKCKDLKSTAFSYNEDDDDNKFCYCINTYIDNKCDDKEKWSSELKKCVPEKNIESFTSEQDCPNSSITYNNRKCTNGATIDTNAPEVYSPLQITQTKKNKNNDKNSINKAFCACETSDNSIIKQNSGNTTLFYLWNDTLGDKTLSSSDVLNTFKTKIDASYPDTDEGNDNLKTAIAYTMCNITNNNSSRTRKTTGMLSKVMNLNKNNRIDIFFKFLVYIFLIYIIFKTFFPTIIGTGKSAVPFEHSLIYALLMPYTSSGGVMKSFAKILFPIILIILYSSLYYYSQTFEIKKDNAIVALIVIKAIGVLVFLIANSMRRPNFSKIGLGIIALSYVGIVITKLVNDYSEKTTNNLNAFTWENITYSGILLALVIINVFIKIYSRTPFTFKSINLLYAIIFFNSILIGYSLYRGKSQETSDTQINLNRDKTMWNILIFVFVVYFILVVVSMNKTFTIFFKMLISICVFVLVLIIIAYNFMIATYDPIVEVILLAMYKGIPDILSKIINNSKEFASKFRTGGYPKLYTAITLFKKPSEDFALPFLNFLLLPAIVYGKLSGEYAPYFDAKPYKTSA